MRAGSNPKPRISSSAIASPELPPIRRRRRARTGPAAGPGLIYIRLHGSPAKYRSSYADGRLETIAAQLEASGDVSAWCIFDNTASGAAAADALKLSSLLGGS